MKHQKLLLLFGLVVLLSACGNKGPVRPLAAPRPGPVNQVELRQQGKTLLLSWRLPDQNLDGSPLRPAPQLDIYRMPYDPADDCPECLDRSTLLVSIDPELPAPARRIADRYLYWDRSLVVGKGYLYKLVPRSKNGPGQALSLRQLYQLPAAAPRQLQAVSQDRSVLLTWQPVLPGRDETLLGYQLYRRRDGAEPSPSPLNSVPLLETRFEDFQVENGIRYHYRLRALLKRGEQSVEGIASAEVAVTPKSAL
jgi:hypothetical protein